MKILHIDSSITGEQSVSRQLTARIVEALRAADPGAPVTYRDVAERPLPHHLRPHLSESDQAAAQASLEEFLVADVVVVGAPMYNFSIPSQLKTWIDTLLVAGTTFAYTANGPQGLAGGKRVIVASSRGGDYSEGPRAAMDHQERYLADVFRLIGIDVEFVRAEGVNMGPDARQQAFESALARADSFAGVVEVAA